MQFAEQLEICFEKCQHLPTIHSFMAPLNLLFIRQGQLFVILKCQSVCQSLLVIYRKHCILAKLKQKHIFPNFCLWSSQLEI